MLRFRKDKKTLDQIDFEHRVALNYLLYSLEEVKIFRKRLEELFVANIHFDIVDEYSIQKDNIDTLEEKVLRNVKFIKQLQDLIEENEQKQSLEIETMNVEKHIIIMHEYDKVLEYKSNVSEKFLDFVAYWH